MTQEEFVRLCSEGTYDQVQAAIDSGIDPNVQPIIEGIPTPAMFIAASSRNYGAIRALVENGVDCTEGFIASVVGGKRDVAHFLVDLGGDINAHDASGTTPLLTAVMMNRADIVEWLVDLGADVDVKSAGGYNALTYAAMMEAQPGEKGVLPRKVSPELIKFLVECGSDCWDAMLIAIKAECESFARTVFEAGADPEEADEDWRNYLMYSVMTGGGLLRTLLECGADPNLPDQDGRTPLLLAALNSDSSPEIVDILLEFDADADLPDLEGMTPLMGAVISACKNPNIILPMLIRTGAFRAEGWESWFAFIALSTAARRECSLYKIRKIIEHSADINAVDAKGMNAIMYALMNGDDEAADILAEAGAAINFELD